MRSSLTRKSRLMSGLLALSLLVVPACSVGTYTVKSGDTLTDIARRLSIPVERLLENNRQIQPEKLSIGQVLTLPDLFSPDAATAGSAETTAGAKIVPAEIPPLNPHQLAAERARMLAQQQGSRLAQTAQRYLGVPYRWAGTTSRGLDCSGLVVRSMAVLGKNVPHRAAALFKMGKKVTYAQLQPGDLVFFNTNGRGVSHVGIWVGDHTFVHASTRSGVKREKMKGYYAKRLVGARRIS